MSLSVQPSDTSSHPVLILDDEPAVLHSLRETLERAGYHVVTCHSPLKALELVRDRDFSVIVTDMRMPEMNGLEFLRHCAVMRPDATRVLITAVLSLSNVLEAINSGAIYRFIPKPWLHEELLAAVENSVERFAMTTRSRQLDEAVDQLTTERESLRATVARNAGTIETLQRSLDEARGEDHLRHRRSLELCWRILNTYDPALGGRTRAIADLAQLFAAKGGFDPDQQRVLTTAAWLCDLGLLGVSRGALERVREHGALTDTDRSLLRNHPVYSQTLAALINEDEGLADTIRSHHEHLDGSGYPDGISGDAIPWTARCLAVVVAFVESNLSRSAGEEFLLRESGRKFDPAAVNLFIRATHQRPAARAVREILMEELRPGMMLSQGVYTPSGLLLVADGQPLTPAMIDKIRFHHKAAPTGQSLIVYS